VNIKRIKMEETKKHDQDHPTETVRHKARTRPFAPPLPGSNNPGMRLLDACFDDVGYARYLLQSRKSTDKAVRSKINWKDPHSGVSILHSLSYGDVEAAVGLLLEYHADPNIRNKVIHLILMIYIYLNYNSSTMRLHFTGLLE
jgi:ankyrin repeat protein